MKQPLLEEYRRSYSQQRNKKTNLKKENMMFSHPWEDIEDITWPRGDTKFIFECWKNMSRVSAANEWNNFQHEKKNFVSPSDHVIFFLLYKMWRFSEDFRRFSKIGQNAARTFSEDFRTFSEDYRRLPKTTEEDPKMFRSYTNKFKFS